MQKYQASNGINWFKRFIIFLLSVVVVITLGLTVYYFLQDDEILGLDSSSIMVNEGDEFVLTIIHQNPNASTNYNLEWDRNVLQCDNEQTAQTVYEFTALTGGFTYIDLKSNNAKFQEVSCSVSVGNGTKSNPFYIKTPEDLASIGDSRPMNASFIQLNDIDLLGYNWIPLCDEDGFSGNYDGAGFAIYNLSVNISETSVKINAGLFAKINAGGSVSRIMFEDADISGFATNAGVVAGTNSGTVMRIQIIKSSVSSQKIASGLCVGGVVGKMERTSANTRLDRVSFYDEASIRVSTTGQAFVGGIVGLNKSGTIINSFSRGVITGIGDQITAGGLAGQNITDSSISADNLTTNKKANIINSYTSMDIDAETKGAIVGLNVNYDGTNSYTNDSDKKENRYVGVYYIPSLGSTLYWTSTATESSVEVEGYKLITAITSEQGKLAITYKTYKSSSSSTYWDFENVWSIKSGVNHSLPTLRMVGVSVVEDIYDPQSPQSETIKNQTDLSKIVDDLEGVYEIGADFTLDANWTVIGTESNPFNGILKGEGYTITVGNAITFRSLFGYLGANAQILNLRIVNANITGGDNVGVLASHNEGLIDECFVSGKITISGSVSKNIGGIVGINSGTGKIYKSTSQVNIKTIVGIGGEFDVGGIAGLNSGNINQTNSSGSIEVDNANGVAYAGGIVGRNALSGSINHCVSNSDITMPITSKNNTAGGIVGINIYRGTVQGCQVGSLADTSNTVNIKGYMVGGLVGENSAEDTNSFVSITKSQVNPNVFLSGRNAGGLVGVMHRGVMNNCATFANLSANIMAGFAVSVEGYSGAAGEGKYAIIDTCFSSAKFSGSSGVANAETSSKIRATNNFLYCLMRGEDTSNPDSYKIAGYIINSKYNKTNLEETGQDEQSYRQSSSAYIGGWNWQVPNDGATSDSNCKKASTFDLVRWSTDIWVVFEGQYPRVNI